MSIQEQLADDLKVAMKSGDTLTKDTVRLIRAAFQNAALEKVGELDDTDVNVVLAKMAKQYRDSITTYRDAGREDLVTKEQAELDVLLRYLPEQMTAEAVREIATKIAEEVGATGPGDKGKLMGKLMPQVKGKADGSVVNSVVTELLESLAS
ncbi:MAG: GatB/YqeY domain-containing protein [Chloroflexi bacterium]|nr:GatB/YqeY domain-containing protein [Chloroflexota bacterium]